MPIQLTPEAVQEISRMKSKDSRPDAGLRLQVKGGGCSGLYYAMDFDLTKTGDHVFDFEGLKVFELLQTLALLT